MRKLRILILGHGRSGKDTVAEILRDKYGLEFVSSSWAAAESVMMPYFEKQGVPYESVETCYADRHTDNNRAVWFDQISAYNDEDPAKLAKEVFAQGHIYVGMRSAREYIAVRESVDYVVWVDASGRGVKPEERDSFDIPQTNEMYVIDNNGTEEELPAKVAGFARYIGLKPILAKEVEVAV